MGSRQGSLGPHRIAISLRGKINRKDFGLTWNAAVSSSKSRQPRHPLADDSSCVTGVNIVVVGGMKVWLCHVYLESAAYGNTWNAAKALSTEPKWVCFSAKLWRGRLERGALVARKRHLRGFETYRRHASSPCKFSDHQLYLSAAGWDCISWIC